MNKPIEKEKIENWRNAYPLDTFYGETKKELTKFIEIIIRKYYERGYEDAIKQKNLIISILMEHIKNLEKLYENVCNLK